MLESSQNFRISLFKYIFKLLKNNQKKRLEFTMRMSII